MIDLFNHSPAITVEPGERKSALMFVKKKDYSSHFLMTLWSEKIDGKPMSLEVAMNSIRIVLQMHAILLHYLLSI